MLFALSTIDVILLSVRYILLYILRLCSSSACVLFLLEPFVRCFVWWVQREIKKLQDKVGQKGMTVVPLKLYFNDKNMLKVEIALALGKNVRDKREDVKSRDLKRDLNRAVKNAY